MIRLVKHSKNDKIPDGDYVLDKTDKFYDMVAVLTPKFKGKWEFVLVDPRIVFINELIHSNKVPEWVDVIILIGEKKIDVIAQEHPEYTPKDKTKKEEYAEMIAGLSHVLDESAKKALFSALSYNMDELRSTLEKLDLECTTETITLKQVQGSVNYTKRVYASDVINAFLLKDARRWKLYDAIVKEIGQTVSYYAMYKYVKNLLSEKEKYLTNEDVKQRIVSKVDAPLICYAYVLFANSNNPNQLYCILHSLENRSEAVLNRVLN